MSMYIPEIKEEVSENAKILVEDGGKIVRTMISKNEGNDPRLHIALCQDSNTGEHKLALLEQSLPPEFAWKKTTPKELYDKVNAQGMFPQITLSYVECDGFDIYDFINQLREQHSDTEILGMLGIESFEVLDGHLFATQRQTCDMARVMSYKEEIPENEYAYISITLEGHSFSFGPTTKLIATVEAENNEVTSFGVDVLGLTGAEWVSLSNGGEPQ